MQLEALEWLLDQEIRIGFQNEEAKREFLYPLERQIEAVKMKLE